MPGIVGPTPVNTGGTSAAVEADQTLFVNQVAAATGLDPRVVYAWVKDEAAYSKGGTGGENFLNLRPAAGDVGVTGQSPGGFDQFANVQDAIHSSVNRIHQSFIWTNPELGGPGLGTVVAQHGTPAQQIAAIASSGWDSGHYGGLGGPALLQDFPGGAKAAGGAASSTPLNSAGTGGGLGIPNPVSGITDVFSSVSSFFSFLTSWRFAEVLGGSLLLLVGLYLLGRQFGVSVPIPGPLGAAASQAPQQPVQARELKTVKVKELDYKPSWSQKRAKSTAQPSNEVPF